MDNSKGFLCSSHGKAIKSAESRVKVPLGVFALASLSDHFIVNEGASKTNQRL